MCYNYPALSVRTLLLLSTVEYRRRPSLPHLQELAIPLWVVTPDMFYYRCHSLLYTAKVAQHADAQVLHGVEMEYEKQLGLESALANGAFPCGAAFSLRV